MDVTSSTNYDEAVRAFELGQRFLREKEYERAIRYLRRAYTLHQPPVPGIHTALVQAENELKQSPLYCHTCYRYRNNCVCENGPSSSSMPPSVHVPSVSSSGNAAPSHTSSSSASQTSDPSINPNPNHRSSTSTVPLPFVSFLSPSIHRTIDQGIQKIRRILTAVWLRWVNLWIPFFHRMGFMNQERILLIIQGFTFLLFLTILRLWIGHGLLVFPSSSSSSFSRSTTSTHHPSPSDNHPTVSDESSTSTIPLSSQNTYDARTTLPSRRSSSLFSSSLPFNAYGDFYYSGNNFVVYSPFGSMFITMIIINLLNYFFRQRPHA